MRYTVIIFVVMAVAQASGVGAQNQDSVTQKQGDEYGEDEGESAVHSMISPRDISTRKGYASEPVRVKEFDQKKWNELVRGKDYSETQPARKRNAWGKDTAKTASSKNGPRIESDEKDSDEEQEGSDDTKSSTGGTAGSPMVSMIVYGLAIAIIAYILFLVFKNVSFRTNKKISKPRAPDPAHVEDIHELEIDKLLDDAVGSGNHRLAIRIYYLGLLQALDERGFIHWKKDKTNRDYLAELFSKNRYYNEVKRLTLAYEEVWYGDHQLSVSTYEKTIALFHLIQKEFKPSAVE